MLNPLTILTRLALALVLAFPCLAQSGRLVAQDPRCESLVDPLAIDAAVPRLTWILTSDRRAERQTAYQILVASTRERLDRDDADLWDSGRVESSNSIHVPYAGRPLASRDACHWKVRVWDRDHQPGPWSAPARWEMGLLNPSDWRAAWIDASPSPIPFEITSARFGPADDPSACADVTAAVAQLARAGSPIIASNQALGGDPARDKPKRLTIEYTSGGVARRIEVAENALAPLPPTSSPYLRREFIVGKPVASARLHITALGVYEPWLNGERVGDHRMAPGWTDYRTRLQYQTFDATPFIRQGPNTLGAIVGPGWFAGRAGLFHARAYYGKQPALRAQLELAYADGSTAIIATDDRWTRHDGPILEADIMDGEVHDARLALDGWCVPGAPTAGWTAVATRDETRSLHAQPDPPVRALAELPARTLAEPSPGRYVFDLGQNMVGVVRLRVRQPAGTRVTLRHAEMLNPDGTLYTANLRGAAATDAYICRGGSAEAFEPLFTFHGFRYVELSGLATPPELDAVTGIVVGTDLPEIGRFECSDPRINQLHSNIRWGLRGNTLSIPTDCPQRDERMGWTADAQVFLPTAAYLADVGPFMTKWMRDIRDAQRADGAHADVAPVMDGLSYGTPVWADAGTFVPWTTYLATGDTRILEENIDSMRRWVDWSAEHSTSLIRDRDRGNDYGDWLSIESQTPKDLLGTAYFARSAWIVSESYHALGRPQEAATYADLFERVRDAFIARYVSPDGAIQSGTQTSSLLALRFDLLPPNLREPAAQRLLDDLESRGWRLTTGFVGVSHLLPVLDDLPRPDAAYRMLMQDAFPSWLFSVKHGATTIWERWDGWTPDRGMNDPGMNSFNHFALGSCGQWLYAGVAGIRLDPRNPGFSHFELRPRIGGGLTHASATYRSVRGTIASSWRLEDGALTLRVEIPANTTATLILPSDYGTINISAPAPDPGHDLDDGIGKVTPRGNETIYELGSGLYEFTALAPK